MSEKTKAEQINAFQGSVQAALRHNPEVKACAVIMEEDNETGISYDLCGNRDMTSFVDFCIKGVVAPNPISRVVIDAFKLKAAEDPRWFEVMRNWILAESERVILTVPVEDASDWRSIFVQLLKAIQDMEDGLWTKVPSVIVLSLYAYAHAALEIQAAKVEVDNSRD